MLCPAYKLANLPTLESWPPGLLSLMLVVQACGSSYWAVWSAGVSAPGETRMFFSEPGNISQPAGLRCWRSRWGEPAGGEGGGVTHWSAAAPGLVLVIGPQITWGREDCVLPGEGLEGALWEADACPQGQRQACPAAFREQRM